MCQDRFKNKKWLYQIDIPNHNCAGTGENSKSIFISCHESSTAITITAFMSNQLNPSGTLNLIIWEKYRPGFWGCTEALWLSEQHRNTGSCVYWFVPIWNLFIRNPEMASVAKQIFAFYTFLIYL